MTSILETLKDEQADLERRVEVAEQRAMQSEHQRYHAEQAAKERAQQEQRERQLDAKETLEGVITVVRAAALTYITHTDNPERARQMIQNFLSKQLHPTVGPIPDMPWGSGELE